MEPELFVIGRIAKAHGLRGEVQIIPETDFPERFASQAEVYLVAEDGGVVRRAAIEGCRRAGTKHAGGRLIIRIRDIETREEAEGLAGSTICVTREGLVGLSPGRHYIFEIIGLKVIALDGRELGEIVDVMRGPANDVYVLSGPFGEALIPATEEVVREIDIERGIMAIYPMPGLIEGIDG
jgi:16S rRNA processing protein RimM